MKRQYFVRFRADNSLARESQVIETDDARRVRDIAWSAAQAWGRKNNAEFVDFDIEWPGDLTENARVKVAAAETTKPTATLELDNRHKFWAVLDALQAYIDNNNDFRHTTDLAHLTSREVGEFEAKQAAAVAIVDKLEDVLAELAET